MRVLRADEKILEHGKPGLERVDGIQFEDHQTLILCAGFEDRSVHSARLLAGSGAKNVTVVLIHYLPDIGENKADEIRKICDSGSCNVIDLTYNRHDPAGFESDVLRKIKNRTRKVWIDISGMTRLLIVQILCLFSQEVELLSKAAIIYCEAEDYPPTEEDAVQRLKSCEASPYVDFSFLSSGIFDIAVLPELATVTVGDSPSCLVAFPSFNPSQLMAVIESSPPSKIALIHGVPPDPGLHWRTGVVQRMNRLSAGPDLEETYLSTLHYQETFEYLVRMYGDNAPFYHITISPTGSKMQAVAVGLFRGLFKDVQIVFPTHKAFTDPSGYTSGVKSTYSLSLASFAILRKQLRQVYRGF